MIRAMSPGGPLAAIKPFNPANGVSPKRWFGFPGKSFDWTCNVPSRPSFCGFGLQHSKAAKNNCTAISRIKYRLREMESPENLIPFQKN